MLLINDLSYHPYKNIAPRQGGGYGHPVTWALAATVKESQIIKCKLTEIYSLHRPYN